MYDFNQLRREIKEHCKKCVTFKRAAFLQRVIDKERWTAREILKMIKGNMCWIPCTGCRQWKSDALTFGSIVNKKNGIDFEYIVCPDVQTPIAIVFPRRNLKENARRIMKMSKLKAFI